MAVTRYATAGSIINDAASELGLGTQPDPYSSSDPNFQQLVAFLKSRGQEIVHSHDWRHLITEWNFTTGTGEPLPGAGIYALPGDFEEMVDQTGWDRTRRRPLGGPLSPEEWQYLKAWQVGVIFTALFRLNTNELWLYPQPPPAGINIALEYKSSSWVIPVAQAGNAGDYNTLGPAGSDTPAATGDICLFDPLLLRYAVKLAWKKEKGFDTSAAQQDYDSTFEKVIGHTTGAPVLSTVGPRLGVPRLNTRYLDRFNSPDTNYGS